MTTCAIAADGTRIAYRATGSGPALLLLAGQANDHRWWDGVRGDFEPHFRVITFDYRGVGDSDSPENGYSTPGFADDAVSVLDAEGVGSAHVYGTSMGGRVAQWIAVNHPERVRGLVLGCTTPGGRNAHVRSEEVLHAFTQPDPAVARAALIDFMYTPEGQRNHVGPYRVLGARGMTGAARRAHLRASNRHDAWDALPRITAPTLIVHGTDDPMAPVANAYLLHELIPNSELLVLPGARHAYFDEFREQASPAVVEFLRSVDAR